MAHSATERVSAPSQPLQGVITVAFSTVTLVILSVEPSRYFQFVIHDILVIQISYRKSYIYCDGFMLYFHSVWK
jgi:hypothetical protein